MKLKTAEDAEDAEVFRDSPPQMLPVQSVFGY